MTNYVISDYLAAFKWDNIKGKGKDGAWFLLVYLLIVLPITRARYIKDYVSVLEWIKYFIIIIPPIYAASTSRLIPICMTKQMFLAPSNKDDRKEYMDKMRHLKIIVPFVMLVIGVAVMLCLRMMDVITVSGYFVSNTLIIVFYATNINSQSYSLTQEKGIFSVSSSGTMLVCEIIMCSSAIIVNLLYLEIDCTRDPLVAKLLIISISLLFQVPATIAYSKCWLIIRDKFSEYETCLRKSDRKELEV